MIYKMNEVCTIESFNSDKILQSLLKGQSSIVIVLTEKIELKKLDYKFLTHEQVQYVKNIEVINDKVNYLVSHYIVNKFYCDLTNCKLNDLELFYNNYGKPHIKNERNINFNISHTPGCSVIAFSYANIGIDVENIERKIEFKNIVDCYFCSFEKKYINGEPIKFFELWVAKEAYLKCIGCGLMKGLRNANINIVDSDRFEIIKNDSCLRHTIQISRVHSQFIIGVTTSEVKNE